MSIADRSLSRLRGSPLPGAGCLGPGLTWAVLSCRTRLFRSFVSRWRAYSAGRCCGGYGRRCAFGWLCRLGLGWVRAIDSRGCVCPGGCSCAGIGRRALLGWLCPYNLGEHCTAPADMLQLHGTLPASFPLINNRPLSERAAGASRRGSGGAQTFPYGCAATGPHIAGLWHGKAYTRVLRGLGAARRRICADGICACLSQMYLFIIRK